MSTYRAKPRKDYSNLSSPGVRGGTQIIMGTIASRERKHNPFNGTIERQVMWVESGKRRYWGTVPRALWTAGVGDRVVFTADVEQSPDNTYVGFFKRPRLVQTDER